MRKIFFLLLILLFTLNGKSQDKSFAIGIQSNIDIYNNSFWGFPNTVVLDSLTFEFPKGEHKFVQKLNFSIGLVSEYKLNKLYLKTGVLYSTKDYKIDYDMDYYTAASNGTTIIYSPLDYSILRFRYLDIDLGIAYEVHKFGKLNIISGAGFKTGLLLHKESKISYKNDNTVYIDKNNTDYLVQHQPNKVLCAIYFDLGIKYNTNKKLSVLLSPFFAQYLNQISPLPMNRNTMEYGIKFSIMYNFKNK